jgi:hypothetical protein
MDGNMEQPLTLLKGTNMATLRMSKIMHEYNSYWSPCVVLFLHSESSYTEIRKAIYNIHHAAASNNFASFSLADALPFAVVTERKSGPDQKTEETASNIRRILNVVKSQL